MSDESSEPNAVILYMGRRYGIGRSQTPPAICLWDLRDRSAPPIKTWPSDEAGWQAGWAAFSKKEPRWIDTRYPPRCPTCGTDRVAWISAAEKVGDAVTFGAFAIGRVSKTFECQNCRSRW